MTSCLTRRRFQCGLAALLAAPALGRAQAWPNKPIRLIVPYLPGGFTDVTARLLGQALSPALGQPVVIDNRPGANGTLGVEALARAPADGHTFAMVIAAHAANTALYAKLPYDPARDIAAVSLVGVSPLVAAVPRDAPFRTVPELLAHARRHPGQLAFGSSGIGSAAHLSTELLKAQEGLDMVHVPYRGAAAALADLMGGQIQFLFDAASGVLQPGRAGKLQLIGVAAEQRLPLLPEVPTFAEQGVRLTGSTWAGLIAPAATPADTLQRMAALVARLLQQDEIKTRLEALGTLPVGSTPEAFERFLTAETLKWGRVIRAARIALD